MELWLGGEVPSTWPGRQDGDVKGGQHTHSASPGVQAPTPPRASCVALGSHCTSLILSSPPGGQGGAVRIQLHCGRSLKALC